MHSLTPRFYVGFLALVLGAFIQGCGRPTGAKQAGGESTSKGDIAAGAIAKEDRPRNDPSNSHLGPTPLDTVDRQQLWGELGAMKFEQKDLFQQRLEGALQQLQPQLRAVEGFGLEVNRPNGERALPAPVEAARDRLQSEIKRLPSATASQWEGIKRRIADAWGKLDDEIRSRRAPPPPPSDR